MILANDKVILDQSQRASLKLSERLNKRQLPALSKLSGYNSPLNGLCCINTDVPIAKCRKPLGMENGNIKNSQITASSQWDGNHAAIQGRLNYKKNGPKQGGWSARTNDLNQWLQIDLINKFNVVTRVATQGRNAYNQWVTKYMLQFSDNGIHFQYYRGKGKASYMVGQIFSKKLALA